MILYNYMCFCSRCNCTLVEEDEPICGSNGLTYANEYELCVYNCEHNINITIKEHKECRSEIPLYGYTINVYYII